MGCVERVVLSEGLRDPLCLVLPSGELGALQLVQKPYGLVAAQCRHRIHVGHLLAMLLCLRSGKPPGSSECPSSGRAGRCLGRGLGLPHCNISRDSLHMLLHSITFQNHLCSCRSFYRLRHSLTGVGLQTRLVQIQPCSRHRVGLRRRVRCQSFRHSIFCNRLIPDLPLVPLHLARHCGVRLRRQRRPGRLPNGGLLLRLLRGCVHALARRRLDILHPALLHRSRARRTIAGVVAGVNAGPVAGAVGGVVVTLVRVVAAAEGFAHLATLFRTQAHPLGHREEHREHRSQLHVSCSIWRQAR
mmetsp:Transcript_31561/g.69091  ORF Transcript_31561/g.69091 Transcript_31561/m.69091 type:complete len:301 (-) Transcript_31561:100-1002(-)